MKPNLTTFSQERTGGTMVCWFNDEYSCRHWRAEKEIKGGEWGLGSITNSVFFFTGMVYLNKLR